MREPERTIFFCLLTSKIWDLVTVSCLCLWWWWFREIIILFPLRRRRDPTRHGQIINHMSNQATSSVRNSQQ